MRLELLPNLRQQVMAVFAQKGYQKSCIKRYCNSWDNLQNYIELRGYKGYSSEIGTEFLNDRHGKREYNELSDREKEVVRHITVLTDMLELGFVRKRVLDNKTITFSGKAGEAFALFINEQSTFKRSSSVQRYKERLYNLYEYLKNEQRAICDIDIPFIIRYLEMLERTKNAANKNDIILTTRIFFRYLCDNGLIKDTRTEAWMSVLKLKKVHSRKIPSVYTPEEVERIIATPDRSHPQGKRDYAMILLATRYGLRVSDIIGLRFTNIDWEKNLLKVNQVKTSKQVSLPLSEEVGSAIIDYIKHGRPDVESPFVFLTAHAPYKELSSNVLSGNIMSWMHYAGIDSTNKKAGAHAMRHSLATNLLGANETLPVISEILGHSTTESTSVYLKVSYDQLRMCALDVPFVLSTFYDNIL